MYMRTARRFARTRSRSGGRGPVAHKQFLIERFNANTTTAIGTITAVNMLAGLETYLGSNFIGTVQHIFGYSMFNSPTTGGNLNLAGMGIGVFSQELATSTTMTSTSLSQGNARYLPWMYHFNCNEATGLAVANAGQGIPRTNWIDIRVKRTIKTVDQDLQLWLWNSGGIVANLSLYLTIVLSTR